MTYTSGSEGSVYLTGMDGQDQDACGFDYQAGPEYSYPVGSDFQSSAKDYSNWTFSPPAPASPYNEFPLSSPGDHQDGSWNLFDEPFVSIQNSFGDGTFIPSDNSYLSCPPAACQAAYRNSNTKSRSQPFVSLAAINETTTFDDMKEEDQISPLSSPTTIYQQHWFSGSSRRNSSSSSPLKTATTPKRRKSSDKEPRASPSRSKSESSTRLRSTQSSRSTSFPATAKSTSSRSTSDETTKVSRTNHNQVEKQYRNRLNGQFENLLETLPKDNGKGADQRVSKAEVLELAKRHIMQLESEKLVLEEERRGLEGDIEELKRRFVRMGGVCLP